MNTILFLDKSIIPLSSPRHPQQHLIPLYVRTKTPTIPESQTSKQSPHCHLPSYNALSPLYSPQRKNPKHAMPHTHTHIQNKNRMAWPNTRPFSSLGWMIQDHVPSEIYNHYEQRCRGLISPKPFSEWNDQTEQDKWHWKSIWRRRVAMRYRAVEWDGGFWGKAQEKCKCKYCRMAWVRSHKRKGRGIKKPRKGGK